MSVKSAIRLPRAPPARVDLEVMAGSRAWPGRWPPDRVWSTITQVRSIPALTSLRPAPDCSSLPQFTAVASTHARTRIPALADRSVNGSSRPASSEDGHSHLPSPSMLFWFGSDRRPEAHQISTRWSMGKRIAFFESSTSLQQQHIHE